MKNKEFYKDEIVKIAISGSGIAMDESGKLVPCRGMDCEDCCFLANKCSEEIAKWAEAEYQEPCEYKKGELCEVSNDGVTWALRYFARKDGKDYLFFYDGRKSGNAICCIHHQKYGTLGKK